MFFTLAVGCYLSLFSHQESYHTSITMTIIIDLAGDFGSKSDCSYHDVLVGAKVAEKVPAKVPAKVPTKMAAAGLPREGALSRKPAAKLAAVIGPPSAGAPLQPSKKVVTMMTSFLKPNLGRPK